MCVHVWGRFTPDRLTECPPAAGTHVSVCVWAVQYGWTALHRAVVGGSLAVVSELLAAGAQVNAADTVRCSVLG